MIDKYTNTAGKMRSRASKLEGILSTAYWWSWNGYGKGQRKEEIERIRAIITELDILLNDLEQSI